MNEPSQNSLTRKYSLDDLVAKVSRTELGSMSSVVNRIIAIIRDQNSNVQELKQVIETDPVLAAKLLKRVNSALYGLNRKILTIQEAIVLVGFSSVKELALSLRVAKLFTQGVSTQWYSRKELWKHSLAVALMAKMIYRREFRERGDDIYAIGLLHDIGIIAEDEVMPQAFAEMLEKAKALSSITEAELQTFGYSHDTVAGKLCALWKLPREMGEIAGKHHAPPRAADVNFRPASTLFIADYYCHAASCGFEFTVSKDTSRVDEACLSLGLSKGSLDLIIGDVITELDAMEAAGELFA